MFHNKNQHRSIRLKGYDYSQAGAYFVALCTQNRECLFGDIVDGKMQLNEVGQIVADEWRKTAIIRDEIELDEWVVMPNHYHGILVIANPSTVVGCRGTARGGIFGTLSSMGGVVSRSLARLGGQDHRTGACKRASGESEGCCCMINHPVFPNHLLDITHAAFVIEHLQRRQRSLAAPLSSW